MRRGDCVPWTPPECGRTQRFEKCSMEHLRRSITMRKVNFTETVLRDANQSLIATRLPYSKFEPILETMDKATLQAFFASFLLFFRFWTFSPVFLPVLSCFLLSIFLIII